MAGPLAGVKVLDFSEGVFGPFCTMMLGDMGAEVTKVERVEGEALRWGERLGGGGAVGTGAFRREALTGGDRAMFLAFNRNKRDVALNITHQRGREIALKLAQEADVVVHNFRPGVMERLGLDYAPLAQVNPRLIYASLYAFGETGPVAHRAGGDLWAQALSGMVSVAGSPGQPPQPVGVSIVDQSSAAIAAFGIMVALFVRERTGIGQELTTDLLSAALHLQTVEISDYLLEGKLVAKSGRAGKYAPPYGAYRAKDRDVVTMMGRGPDWPGFCRMMGLEYLENDPRFATDDARQQHHQELYPILDALFAQRTAAEWQQVFRAHQLRCDPVLTHAEVVAHPQVEANEMVITLEHPLRGPLKMVGIPVKLKKTPARPPSPPPLLGQHTAEILHRLGYSPQEIAELEKAGVTKTAPFPTPPSAGE